MQYSAVTFQFNFKEVFAQDLFINELAQTGFESFEETTDGTIAYIPTSLYNYNDLQQVIDNFPYEGIRFVEKKDIEDKDWNEEWEKNYFQPIIIDDQCVIHSTFHHDIPALHYDIIINPQMAFGTGHHQTTSMMLRAILENDFAGKDVLDMGCGTAVLAIFAKMKGAKNVTAIDIDDWCVRNALENIELNKLTGIEVLLGDAGLLKGRQFDIILANINRNILLNDMPQYVSALRPDGALYISGFYSEDINILAEKAETLNLKITHSLQTDNWTMLKLEFEK